MTAPKVPIRDWHSPAELEPADITACPNITTKPDATTDSKAKEAAVSKSQAENYSQDPNHPRPDSLIDKLLPLFGSINNGAFDITTLLDLFDKSGQGLGAIGKLLPIIAPLIKGFKKNSKEDTIDYKTINLDS